MGLMDVVENLRKHAAEVPRKLKAAKRSEANTSRYLVEPFCQALGYDPNEPEDMEPEFTADVGIQREKVDYALKREGKPIVLVEVKYAGATLDDHFAAQLRRYFSTKLDVRFGILTNGLEFRFYSDLEKPNVMDDEPFMTLDMRHLDHTLAGELTMFAKSVFDVDRALSAARTLKYKGKIDRLLNEAFNPLSEEIIEMLIRRAYSGRYTKAIRAEFKPLVVRAWQQFLSGAVTASSPTSTSLETTKSRNEKTNKHAQTTPPNIGQHVRVSVQIDYKPRGSHTKYILKGTLLLSDGIGRNQSIVEYEGEILPPSEAAGRAIRTVNPGVSNPNGWRYWTFVNPNTGKDDVIDLLTKDSALRSRLLDGR